MENYYEILEVNEKASIEIIKKIIKINIKKNHPDLFTGKEKLEAEEKVEKLNEAYATLSDEIKRKEYDLKLEQERKNSEEHIYLESLEIENEKLKKELQRKNDILEYYSINIPNINETNNIRFKDDIKDFKEDDNEEETEIKEKSNIPKQTYTQYVLKTIFFNLLKIFCVFLLLILGFYIIKYILSYGAI